MEIERKWLTKGWPWGLEETARYAMRQGYISLHPTVRIREEALEGGRTARVLCFKGPADSEGLAREEIETEISADLFARLEKLIGKPLIVKEQRRYALPGGLTLEANRVDAEQPGEFWYAEVEFPSEEMARSWTPQGELQVYLSEEVTRQRGQTMGAYWRRTRGTCE